jgi:hypothetical protein
MKLWKYGLIIVGVTALMLSSGIVSAETQTLDDPENDVIHLEGIPMQGGTYTENIGDQPNIDIKSISATANGDKFMLTFEVAADGIIQSNPDYYYMYTVITSDGSTYIIQYYGGESSAIGARENPQASSIGQVSISGNTISAEFDIIGDSTVTEFQGDCNYNINEQNVYRDIAPNSESDQDTGGDDTGGDDTGDDTNGNNEKPKKTPGFEVIAVIAAIGVAFILLKRKK